jgi:hypothetical protein
MSEQAVEDQDVEPEDEADEEPDDEQEPEQPVGDELARTLKQLERAKKEAIRNRLALKKLKAEAQQGDPNKGEMEKLADQVKQLDARLQSTSAVAALLEAGFNGTRQQAEKMIRLVDDFSDEEWIEELKVDFSERFGRRRTPEGQRVHTGSGRDDTRGASKDPDKAFADKLMGAANRRR